MEPRSAKKVKSTIFFLPVLLGISVFFLSRLPTWRRFELITYDWRMKTVSVRKVTGNVVIVFVGDETLKMLGRWPIPRYWYAGLNEVLKVWGARIVAYDILFLEESGDRKADYQFQQSINQAGNVILPCFFEGELFQKADSLQGKNLLLPPAFLGKPLCTGFLNTPTDEDGITRRYPLFISYQGKLIPSLGLAILKEYYNLPASAIKMVDKDKIALTVQEQERIFPVDSSGSVWLKIYPDLRVFPQYALVQVLQSYDAWSKGKTPFISPDRFTNKIVLVAHTAAGTTDIGPVSGKERYLKAGLHASFLENFFQNEFLRPAGYFISFLLPVMGAITASLSGVFFPAGIGFFFTIFLGCLFIVVASWLFSSYGLWLEIVPTIVSLFLTSLTITLTQFLSERREKTRLRSVFQRYIAPSVMEKLLSSSKEISLGGEKKVLTVLFADVRGFTALAEKIPPEKTVVLLNEMFSIVEEAIFAYGGTLDKFIGDAVMAIYGAPVEQNDHAQRAVFSAIEMVRKLKRRQESLPLMVGVGINTGVMVIGNVGTVRRIEYTAIGDAVNLAARIESQAKAGEILISEDTYQLVKDVVDCEAIGSTRVKGRDRQVNLYRVKMEQGVEG